MKACETEAGHFRRCSYKTAYNKATDDQIRWYVSRTSSRLKRLHDKLRHTVQSPFRGQPTRYSRALLDLHLAIAFAFLEDMESKISTDLVSTNLLIETWNLLIDIRDLPMNNLPDRCKQIMDKDPYQPWITAPLRPFFFLYYSPPPYLQRSAVAVFRQYMPMQDLMKIHKLAWPQ